MELIKKNEFRKAYSRFQRYSNVSMASVKGSLEPLN